MRTPASLSKIALFLCEELLLPVLEVPKQLLSIATSLAQAYGT